MPRDQRPDGEEEEFTGEDMRPRTVSSGGLNDNLLLLAGVGLVLLATGMALSSILA